MNPTQQKQNIIDHLLEQSPSEIVRLMQDHRKFYRFMVLQFPNRPVGVVALHYAIREGVTRDICQYTSISSVVAERFARRLSEQTGLTLNWSLWAVQTWSNVSGVQATIKKRVATSVPVQRVSKSLLGSHKTNVVELQGHRKTILDVEFSPSGRYLATSSMDRSIRLWDVRSGKLLASFLAGHRDWIRTIGFQPDGTRLISGGDDGSIRVWDLTSGRRLQRFPAHQGWVLHLVFSTDGSLMATAGQDGMVLIWSAESLEVVQRIGPFGTSVQKVSISYDGEWIAIAMAGRIEVWSLRDRRRLYRKIIRGERTSVLALPDGELLITSAEGLQKFSPMNEDVRTLFSGHEGAVWGAVLDPVSPIIASFGQDRTVRFWDGRDGTAIWTMKMKADINGVSLSNNGRLGIALASSKGWLWEMERAI